MAKEGFGTPPEFDDMVNMSMEDLVADLSKDRQKLEFWVTPFVSEDDNVLVHAKRVDSYTVVFEKKDSAVTLVNAMANDGSYIKDELKRLLGDRSMYCVMIPKRIMRKRGRPKKIKP